MADVAEILPTASASSRARSWPAGWYAHYVLLLLCLSNALNLADRQVMSVLLEPIKVALHASDTAMSMLTSVSFVVFYSLFGIPIAMWADRGNRRNILALGVVVYSALTAACGMAGSFIQMAAMRAGVGVGEATGTPASMSLISDYYSRRARAGAMAIYFFPIGAFLVTPLIGIVAERYGWRAALYASGIPGLLVGALIYLTMKEPRRGAMDDNRAPVQIASLKMAMAAMVQSKPLMLILIGTALAGLGYGTLTGWGNALMMRAFHVTAGQIGTIAMPLLGVGMVVGTLAGGFLTTAVVKWRKSERWMILIPALGSLTTFVAGFIFVYGPTFGSVVVGGMLGAGSVALRQAPHQAVALDLVPANLRGLASALMIIATNVVGMAGGPLVVGIISDYLTPSLGPVQALRTAFLFVPFSFALASIPFFMALKYYDKDGLIVDKAKA
jgi:MFS family permease